MHAMWARGLGGAWLAMAACTSPAGTKAPEMDEHGGSTTEAVGTTTNGGTIPPSITVPTTSTPGDESSESMDGVIFLLEPDFDDPMWECDILTQDCPRGEKCMLVEEPDVPSGGGMGSRCMPIVADPAAPGEPCTRTGDRWSGIDTCERGALCWNVDPETLEGTCFAFCTGDENNLMCEDPDSQCEVADSPPYVLCIPRCDPLEQDCPAGQACYPIQDGWSCAPDASGEAGGYGDACEFINVCDPGYICLSASTVPPGEDCEGTVGCCTAVCDLGDPLGDAQCEGAAGGQTCQSWYEEGAAPPGFEDVGACALPA